MPWTIRNAVEFDRFIPVRIGVGQNLWEGLGEIPNDFGAVLDDRVTEEQVRAEAPELRYGTPEYDDHLREKAYDAIAEHPGHYLKVIGRRLVVSTIALHNSSWIEATDPSLTEDPRVDPGHAVTRVWDLARLTVYALLEPVLFLIAVIVFAATWRALWRRHVFLIAVVAATLAPYMVLHVEARYVLACLFVYMIAFGLAADWGLERLRERRRRVEARA